MSPYSSSRATTAPEAAAPAAGGGLWGRSAGLVRAYPYTALVFALGIVLRAILIPITHGQDFVVWNLASRGTLAGINVYAHHPHYPGGPYTYFPLFLYAELPFQWLALHAGVTFTVLGKLPIVAGDVLAAALIVSYVRRRGFRDGGIALATALYFLNPLVLYNGAFYGRFDAFCVGLFLLALRFYEASRPRSWRFPLLYAVAVAAKTYPGFILPWFLVREPARRNRVLLALVIVLGGMSLPFLLTSPKPFVRDVVLYDGTKLPGNLSWQILLLQLHLMTPHAVRLFSYLLLALYVGALFLFTRLDLYTYSLVAILLFLVLSKVVIEQYFLWPMPFLIFKAMEHRSWTSRGLLALLTLMGTFINPYIHPFGQEIPVLNVLAAACILTYALTRRPQEPSEVSFQPSAVSVQEP